MADNLNGIPFTTPEEGIDFPTIAKDLVYQAASFLDVHKYKEDFHRGDVYLVWFGFTLGNWKALCSTSVPDGRYYEVTFNKEKSEAYIDTYLKTHNHVVNIEL